MRARDGGKIGIAQLELDGARIVAVLAQAAADFFGQVRDRGVNAIPVERVAVERMFVADGFRLIAFADFGIEPPAGVETLRLACQRESPFAEARFEIRLVERRKDADAAAAARV